MLDGGLPQQLLIGLQRRAILAVELRERFPRGIG
jgi:hypothetical protein